MILALIAALHVSCVGSAGANEHIDPVQIGFGSCLHHDRQPWALFDSIAANTNLTHFLFLGDLIYADWNSTEKSDGDDLTGLSEPELQSLLNRLYANAFADKPLTRFLEATPTSFMWDDHELRDNYDEGPQTAAYRTSKEVYIQHVAWRNPPPEVNGELYYTLTLADAGVSAFVLDARSHRSPVNMSDDVASGKSMLGSVQLARLKAWLLDAPPHHFKVIASSVMWNDQAAFVDYLDGWAHYKRERDAILTFISNNEISNIVLVSADAHWSGIFHFPNYDIYEFSVSPLASPPLPAPEECKGHSDSAKVEEKRCCLEEGDSDSALLFKVSGEEGLLGLMKISSSDLIFQMMHLVPNGSMVERYSQTLKRRFPMVGTESV